jgi:hypothetical protein
VSTYSVGKDHFGVPSGFVATTSSTGCSPSRSTEPRTIVPSGAITGELMIGPPISRRQRSPGFAGTATALRPERCGSPWKVLHCAEGGIAIERKAAEARRSVRMTFSGSSRRTW